MKIFTNLNNVEIAKIYGGSEASHDAGYKLGQDVRNALDNVGLISLIVLIATKGRVKV